jgi:hypothetical protein
VERTQRKSMWFGVMVVLAIYVLVSVAIAIMTVDTCGDESAGKNWAQLPYPHWDCDQADFQIRRG